MTFTCCSDERRKLVKNNPVINGIDFLEVVDNPADPSDVRQTVLLVHFIKALQPGDLKAGNFSIEGGERITDIIIQQASPGSALSPPAPPPTGNELKIMRIKVDKAGDFSTYTLNVVSSKGSNAPPKGHDPILSSIDFSFKVLCSNNIDCKTDTTCEPSPEEIPNINYLAKDFQSFRRVMLDRLSLLLPGWQERNPADLGITLVELLAYTGDQISYQQDAIATEAYIGTARKRISARRHARLVDYYMHDGSNARCWVQITIDESIGNLALTRNAKSPTTKFLTGISDKDTVLQYNSESYEEALYADMQVFELMHNSQLFSEHNSIDFYTWGNTSCCLPKGSTSADLVGNLTNLQVGDILIFIEVKGPETGNEADADPSQRHAVRITQIKHTTDPLGREILGLPPSSPPGSDPLEITRITWHIEDALPFPLCISSGKGNKYYDKISVALGNIVLADHGITWEDDNGNPILHPAIVPEPLPILNVKAGSKDANCATVAPVQTPARYKPRLKYSPLTQAAPYKNRKPFSSATSTMQWTISEITPEIVLYQNGEDTWRPRKDLLNSDQNAKHFVVEIENDGTAFIRFGDDTHGARPESGSTYTACYRTGNGEIGNIGAEKIGHIASNDPLIYSNPRYITKVWNPMAATGGFEAETIDEVRQKVGEAFKTQKRAVTEDDYAHMAKNSDSSIQRAAADFRWTGSWYTSFVSFDRFGGASIDKQFTQKVKQKLDTYRMAGQDIKVGRAKYVPLSIEMTVWINKEYDRNDVRNAIFAEFTNGLKKNGQPGLFHPDNFTFGDTIYLSKYYAAAQAISGVCSVQVTKFERPGIPSSDALDEGKILFGHLEIPRLDNDPNHKENGSFNLTIKKEEV